MTLDEPLTETGRWQAESVRQQLIVGSLLQRQKKIKILLPRMQGVMILHIIHIGFCTYTYIYNTIHKLMVRLYVYMYTHILLDVCIFYFGCVLTTCAVRCCWH